MYGGFISNVCTCIFISPPRYGKITSTKAILDKQTNVCKGMHQCVMYKCTYVRAYTHIRMYVSVEEPTHKSTWETPVVFVLCREVILFWNFEMYLNYREDILGLLDVSFVEIFFYCVPFSESPPSEIPMYSLHW